MKDKLKNLFDGQETILSYRNIKRVLGVCKRHVDVELKSALKELEFEGILYEDDDSIFRSAPSNFFVTELRSTRKGLKYVELNDSRFYIFDEDINGAMAFDKVLVSIDNDRTSVVKVLSRTVSNLACEVIEVDGVKTLKPLLHTNLDIIAGSQSMKKLKVGDVALFKVNTTKFEGKYDADLVRVIGKSDDDNILYDAVSYNNGFKPKFDSSSLEEIKSEVVNEEDFEGRVDLRTIPTFTIDDPDTKDMDDALSIKKTKKGYTLYVHIAHVSHYVKFGSKLFDEAYERCTSLYFDNKVMPMLPPVLSDNLCSLMERKDRLARTLIIRFDLKGNLIDYDVVKSVIRSKKKMDYKSVEAVISHNIVPDTYEDYVKDLMLLKELNNKINKNESFNLGNLESESDLNQKYSSHRLVRDYMVLANHLIALYMTGKPCIYRNHPVPSEKRIKETLNAVKELGYNINNLSNLNSSLLFDKLYRNLKEKNDLLVLCNMIIGNLKMAYYGVENEGHFSLGYGDGYVHFTSPDRRFPDLVNSNLLDLYEKDDLTEEDFKSLKEFLIKASKRASMMERLAEKATVELEEVSVLKRVRESIGNTLEAYIEGINKDYIVIRYKGMMNGILKLEDMICDDLRLLPSGNLKSRSSGAVYKVGHKIEVQIKDVSFSDGTIYYKEIRNITLDEVNELKLKKASMQGA